MSEVFEKWLVEHEFKSPRTAYQYSKAINRISRHYSTQTHEEVDLYKLRDLSSLQGIAELYGNTGKFASYENNKNGTHRAALKMLCRFRERSKNITSAHGTFQELENIEYDYLESDYAFSRKQDLKRNVIAQAGQLFPEYHFYVSKEESIDFSLGVNLVDVLLEKDDGSLLALEIIPGLATSESFGSFSLLLGLLLDRFPDQKVRGCIIAGEIDQSLRSVVRTSEFITLNTYSLGLRLQPGYGVRKGRRKASRASLFRSLLWF